MLTHTYREIFTSEKRITAIKKKERAAGIDLESRSKAVRPFCDATDMGMSDFY